MAYQIAINHNNAAGLGDVVPQPRSFGVADSEHQIDGDGNVIVDGYPTAVWEWTELTETQYSALLTQCGLTASGTASRNVTVRTKINSTRGDANFNAKITRPAEPKYEKGFWRNIRFNVTRMEAL